MNRLVTAWYWSLPFLPFSAVLTLTLTLIICINTPNNAPADELPQISELGTGQAYVIFVIGFILLIPQVLLIVIGRLQFLIQSQDRVPRWLLYIVHLIPLFSGIFMLIMATVNIDRNINVHLTGAFGMFGLIALYLLLHTVLIFYLWLYRSKNPLHASILYLLYFIVCTALLVVFVIIWIATSAAIPEYLAAAAPFLYFIGFVPQFWTHRRRSETFFESLA
jgi:hypothetical protein